MLKEAGDFPRDIKTLEVLGLFQGGLIYPTGTSKNIPEVSY